MNLQPSTSWRAACLRGVALGPEGPHALLLISAGQYLRVPLPDGDLPWWQEHIGERVWIDPCHPQQMLPGSWRLPTAPSGARHA